MPAEQHQLEVKELERILAEYARAHRLQYVADPEGNGCGTPIYRLHWWAEHRLNTLVIMLQHWGQRQIFLEQRNWPGGIHDQIDIFIPTPLFWLLAVLLIPLSWLLYHQSRLRHSSPTDIPATADEHDVWQILDRCREPLARDWVSSGPKFGPLSS